MENTNDREKTALDKLKEEIVELMLDSELFECEDPSGMFTDEVVSRVGDQVSIMFDNTDEELEELEMDLYYKNKSLNVR